MAQVGDALFNILTNDATVGGLVSTRVYPHLREQGSAFPAVTYQRVGGPRTPKQEGPANHVRQRVQLNSYAGDSTTAQDLADAVRQALDGVSGTYGGMKVQGIECNDAPIDDFDPVARVFRVIQDFIITHAEATP